MSALLLKFTEDERRVVAESFGKLEQAELAYHSTLAVIARLHGLNPLGLELAQDGSGFVGRARPQAPAGVSDVVPTAPPDAPDVMPDLNECGFRGPRNERR